MLISALSQDGELASLYAQATTQLSEDQFRLNHSRLLKAFLQNLRNEAGDSTSEQFRRATRYLQSQPQRANITSGIWEQFTSPSIWSKAESRETPVRLRLCVSRSFPFSFPLSIGPLAASPLAAVARILTCFLVYTRHRATGS